MKPRIALVLLAAMTLLGLVPTVARAEGSKSEASTVQGEILDLACYISHDAKGSEHEGCAKKCLAGGQPMGLLANDGTVYLLFADHQDATAFKQAKELAGKTVEVKGSPSSRAGLKGITVQSVKTL